MADIRHRVDSGDWPAGTRIPSETVLQAEYACARESVRRAMHMLCNEGVLQARAFGRFVRRRPQVNLLEVPAGSRIAARMPTEQERAERDMPAGVPVIVITEPDGEVGVYPGDATEVLVPLPRRDRFDG